SKTCSRGRSVRAPPAPAPPRGAGRGNPTSVPGRIRRDRLESRHLELDLRHHIRRGVFLMTLENDRLGAVGRFGVEVKKLLPLRSKHPEHELAPDAPGIGLKRIGHILDRSDRYCEDGRVILRDERQSSFLDDELPLDLFGKPRSPLDVFHIGENVLRPDPNWQGDGCCCGEYRGNELHLLPPSARDLHRRGVLYLPKPSRSPSRRYRVSLCRRPDPNLHTDGSSTCQNGDARSRT